MDCTLDAATVSCTSTNNTSLFQIVTKRSYKISRKYTHTARLIFFPPAIRLIALVSPLACAATTGSKVSFLFYVNAASNESDT